MNTEFTISLRLVDACEALTPRGKKESYKRFNKRTAALKDKKIWIEDITGNEALDKTTIQRDFGSIASNPFSEDNTFAGSLALIAVLHTAAMYIASKRSNINHEH